MTSPFNETHAAMTALRAGDRAAYEEVLGGMKRTAAANSEIAPAYRDISIPAAEAMACFTDGDYAGAVEGLLTAEAHLWRMGGSVAQRDLVAWTLTAAAVRAGRRNVALALANERLALRPGSAVNRRFLQEARAIAA